VQIPAFRNCESAEIVSVASGSFGNAEATANEFGIAHFTADWRETVSRKDVDLVCITTPPKLHREMTLFAIEQGKHVLCEKPMAMNVSEAAEMLTAANKASVFALIDHELRFQPGRQKAFSMLREGAIGNVRHAKYLFQASYRANPSLPWNWWSDLEQGGGALGAINSHIIDSFHWLLGTEVSSVFCQLQTQVKQRPHNGEDRSVTADDEANMLLRFADSDLTEDTTGLVSVSMTEGPKHRNRIEFYGTDGAMRIEDRGDTYLARCDETEWRQIQVEATNVVQGMPETGFPIGFMRFAPKIVDGIASGSTRVENAATFDDGVAVQKVLDAARESDRTSRRVELV
jgi:Predicted dehydrogenases and related proteins